ncbi:MAG: 23S rRNA (pseudouridine(1915)-N(3))-methyltransferase RlmH [Eubacterium sp.]|nr:23S rRNA (pseudouridine(1915)-N(3))-methyltransferase RlmH [Eubacterium sp.]
MVKNKIIAAGAALIVLIIIASFSAMSIVQSSTVGDVEKSSVQKIGDTSATLEWKKVSSADGYYIYQSNAGENDFEKVATAKDLKKEEFTVKNLEQATAYDFYITAFKNSKKKVESKEYTVLSLCTKPTKQKINSIESTDPGVLTFAWEINPKARGYELEYIKGDGKDFTEAQSETIADKATGEFKIEKLEAKATYSVRVRTFIKNGKENTYGAWSDVKSVKIAEKIALPSNIDPNKPMIALTFDDGPGYNKKASSKILNTLEKYNAKATFFMVGNTIKGNEDNLKKKAKLGMELSNHTWNHDHFGKAVTASDIKKCSQRIYEVTGQYPTSFRSPGGNTTELIRNECKAENMPLYYWSIDTLDWKSKNADAVYNKVMKQVKDGDIILMHELYDSTAAAVERMVPELIKQGYQLVTCEQLVYAKTGKKPVPGTQYLNATTIKNQTS